MKTLPNFNDLMIELLEDNTRLDENGFNISDRSKQIIHEISKYAKECSCYKKSLEHENAKWLIEEKSIRVLWVHMLDRIVSAPTTLHRDFAVLCVIPYIDNLLEVQK